MRIFLIGGGRDSAAIHEPFVRAAGRSVVAFVLDEGADTDPGRWSQTLTAAGATEPRVVVISSTRPARPEDLDGASGVYVAGGLTPGYHAALVGAGTGWLDRARDAGLVYAGFSAGAAIAPVHALLGGWQVEYRGARIQVCDEDCGEDLDDLTVRPGLGLVPFTVDVHAAQWGTLNRLVHALSAADLDEGWAIDEHTALETGDGVVTVHGRGAATRVVRDGPQVRLRVHGAGDRVPVAVTSEPGCYGEGAGPTANRSSNG